MAYDIASAAPNERAATRYPDTADGILFSAILSRRGRRHSTQSAWQNVRSSEIRRIANSTTRERRLAIGLLSATFRLPKDFYRTHQYVRLVLLPANTDIQTTAVMIGACVECGRLLR